MAIIAGVRVGGSRPGGLGGMDRHGQDHRVGQRMMLATIPPDIAGFLWAVFALLIVAVFVVWLLYRSEKKKGGGVT